ncbi:MAG: hypothetical protein IIZ98_00260 [Erysipelotrichaceae bacterium]|nr:hypothetical protein [Erysipelotrichaceae bacterium]
MYYSYEMINKVMSQYNPSSIHTKDTALFRYYQRYLFQKVMSVFEFKGLNPNWPENYFYTVLFGFGFIAIADIPPFMVIPQHCTISGPLNVFYQPKEVIIANPAIKDLQRLEIGKDCEVIKMMPDWGSPIDIVNFYADMMALSAETAAVNTINSKLSYVLFAKNKAMAESLKKLYDQVASGEPATVVDKLLMNDDGSPNWDTFTQDLKGNYIAGQILEDMKQWEDRFNTDIGIPNANTQKKERLITDEVNANNVDTRTKSDLWLATMREGVSAVNKHYGMNISVDYRKRLLEGSKIAQEEGDESWQED